MNSSGRSLLENWNREASKVAFAFKSVSTAAEFVRSQI